MHKYHAISSFYIWPDICAVAMNTFKQLLVDRGATSVIPDFDWFWADLHRFVELKHAHGRSRDAILSGASEIFHYDIPRWLANDMPHDVRAYKHQSPEYLYFDLTPDAQAGLGSALHVWTTSVQGLSKMVTRINALWQHRRVAAAREREYLCQTA
jgi:hypothetical protein